ncbi:MAG TPA: hypothetical protein VGN34_23350 [Ktedonobacteraceae bacterium]|jgi:hypothetical protein
MTSLSDHPTVKAFQAKQATPAQQLPASPVDANWLRTLCLEAGTDDVGFVEIDHPALADQCADILKLFPPDQSTDQYGVAHESREYSQSCALACQS